MLGGLCRVRSRRVSVSVSCRRHPAGFAKSNAQLVRQGARPQPALLPAVVLGSVWTFNMFNVIYLVSGGGPDHQTNILITEAYDAFKVMKRYGYAAAYSLLIFAVLYAYGALTNRITRATEGAFQ